MSSLFHRTKKLLLAAALICLGAIILLIVWNSQKSKVYDPYENMVQAADGAGGYIWIVPSQVLTAADYPPDDFRRNGEFVTYEGDQYSVLSGIDVSEHQGEIDWEAVKAAGVEFAVIRAGYRGYSQGALSEDAYFDYNISQAERLGLKVGVYFFSQAVNITEAIEEAEFMLELLEGHSPELPVFFDWENISGEAEARTNNVSGETVTECCLAFAQTIESEGYVPGVYFYRSQGYHMYDLDRLEKLVFWSAAPGDSPDFYYDHRFWQYSYTGRVPGVETDVDLNLMLENTSQ